MQKRKHLAFILSVILCFDLLCGLFPVSANDSFTVSANDTGNQHVTVYVTPGASTTLRATVTPSSAQVTYNWHYLEFDEANGTSEYYDLPGETGSTLYLQGINRSRQYSCEVSDYYSTQTVDFSVIINNGLQITEATINGAAVQGTYSAAPGEAVTLYAKADGIMRFERRDKERRQVSVYPVEEAAE